MTIRIRYFFIFLDILFHIDDKNSHTNKCKNSWEDHAPSNLLESVLEREVLRSHGRILGGQSDRVEMGGRKLQRESEANTIHVFGM